MKPWRQVRLGFLVDTIVPQRDKPEDLTGPIPWLRIEDFDGRYLSRSKSGQGVTQQTVDAMHLRVFPPRTVVTACSCSMGATAITSAPVVTNQTFIGLLPDETVLYPEFLAYALLAKKEELQAQATGAIQQYLSQQDFRSIRVALPALAEQRAIADFLDRETAQIDAMVDAQERLVALLEERRKAAIDQVIMRGMRSAELVPSDVPWLGVVPKHWSVTAIKHAYESLAGYAFPSDGFSEDPDDVALLRGINIAPGRIAWEAETYYWDTNSVGEVERYLLREGDIVLGLDRPIISSGIRAAQVAKADLPALLLQRVARFRPSGDAEPRLLFYWLSSSAFVDYLTPSFTGVSVPHISEGQVRNFVAALPPLDEQREIVEHLDRSTAQADAMIAKARESIALMKERRAALISAAVTGRIDVRTGIEQVERDLEEARA